MRSQSNSRGKNSSNGNNFRPERNERGDKPHFTENPPCNKVYVTFLPQDIEESQLKELFQECGTVARVFLKKKDDGFTFANIQYQSIEEARNAIEKLNRRKIGGKSIKVQFSKEMVRSQSIDSRGGSRERTDRGGDRNGQRRGGDFPRQSQTRRRFEGGDGDRGGRGRGGRGRGGGFRDEGQRHGNRDGGRGPMKCFKCQGEGHTSKNCQAEEGEKKGDYKGGKNMKSSDKMSQQGFSDY